MADLRFHLTYSHRDTDWRDRLMAHLAPLKRTANVVVWDDVLIDEITEASRTLKKLPKK